MITTAGTKLEIIRREKKLTQQEVADYLGISRNTLTAYESGKSKIPLSVFIRLADLYKCDVFEVFSVHAQNIEFDVPEIEIIKAQAKYKVLAEKQKDDAFEKNYFSKEYYAMRYKEYLKEATICYRTKKNRTQKR